MRSFLSLFAMTFAFLLLSVGVKSQTVTLLNEDFNSTTSGVPTGWDNSGGTTSSSYTWQADASGYNGTYCMKYDSYWASSGTYGVLKTPVLNLNGQYILRFKYQNYNAGTFDVYISTDGGTTYTTALQTGLTTSTSSEWGEAEISLTPYMGQSNVRIVFYSVSNYGSYRQYLDDVSVISAPTCQNPSGAYISGLTGSGATVNWGLNTSYGQSPDRFRVTLRDLAGNVVAYNGAVSGYSSSFSFTGLSSNTTYTAYVRSDCDYQSYAGFSDSIAVQFTTLPSAQSVPFYEDFNSMSAIPNGYYHSNATLNTSATYSYGNTGNSIKLTTTAATGAYIIFPLLNVAANNVEMDFYLRRQSSGSNAITYQAGYLTDPSDIEGTFYPIYNDSIPKDAAWHNVRFNTAASTDVTNPVMLCVYVGSGYATSVYVDNVSIHTIPTCTRPEGLNITNYTATDVTLDWSMANANNVRIYAMNTADSSVVTALATQHPYTMTGLTPQTTYQFNVRGICSATDSSEISTSVTVTTRCATASTPIFFEGAEGTTGSLIPDCWETGHIHKVTTDTSDPFYTGTTYHHTGSRGFVLRDMTSGNIAYLCSQKMDFGQTAGTYSFRYWYYRPSGTSYVGEGLKVFVTATPGDTTNAVQVIPFVNRYAGNSPVSTTTGWNEYEGMINYTGEGYIMVVGYSKYGSSSYFDDMEVFTTPTCPKVSAVSVGNVAQTTAQISWTPGNTETQWIVDYTLSQGSTVVEDTTIMVSGQPNLTLSNLISATTYSVAATVRAYCGVGDTAEAVSISGANFTTQCSALSAFPYTMGFEDSEIYVAYSSYRHPMCWTLYNTAASTSSYHYYPYANTSYPHNGSRALYFYSYKSSTTYPDTAIFSLPQVDTTILPVNDLRIKFWSRSSSTSYSHTVFVGVMTDPNNSSSFVKIDSVTITGNTYVENIINLNNYVGNGTYVALGFFKSNINTSYAYDYIDDVTLEAIPSCADLSGGLTLTAATDSTASFAMSDQTATAWQYAYGLTGTPIAQMTPVSATGSTLTLTGLGEATTYDIYVRRDCGTSGYGAWSAATTFSTTAVPATMPYICGFEDPQENARWQYADGAGVNVFTVGTDANAHYADTSAMYVTSSRSTKTYTYNISSSCKSFAYRTLHFDAKGYQVEMKAKCTGGESSYDFGRIFLTSTSEVLPIGGTGDNYSSTTFPNMVAQFDQDFTYSNNVLLNQYSTSASADANGWVTISYFLDMTNRPGDYNLVLMWNDDSSAGTASYPLAVDNIHIYELTCIPPSSIVTDSLNSTSVKLNIQQATASQWEVVVADASFTKDNIPDSTIYRAIVSNPSVWINSLTPNTDYYYSVRTICGANDTSDWSTPASFHTFCSMVNLPLTEDFESTTLTNCWTNIATTGSISRYTGYKHAGNASMKVATASAVSPELNVTTLAPDMINGWCYSTVDSATFYVGVMTDPNDAQTYTELTTVVIPVKNTWTEFTSYFTLLTDPDYSDWYNAKYIVVATGDKTIYFDDLIIDQTPTCPKPTEVSITNIGAHSFDISFTNNAPGCTQFVVTTNGTEHVINTNPATITGLAAATSYNVKIAAICSSTDTSYYTTVGNIKTTCDVVTAPYTENFEGFTASTIPDCWDNSGSTTSTLSTNSSYVWGVYNYSSNNMLRMYNYLVQSGNAEIITPSIALPAGNGYELKYDVSNRSSSGNMYVEIKTIHGTSYVNIDTVASSGSYSQDDPSAFTTRTIDLTSYAGDTINLKFFNVANYGSGAIFLDNVSVKALLNCSDPNVPTISNITASSAFVTFSDTCASHNSWQYVYGQRGFNPNTATPIAVDSTRTFNITGLTSGANYEVYVRAICGVGDTSNYVGTLFRTLCTPFHVTANTPFSENFADFNYGAYISSEGPCYTLLNEPTSTSYKPKVYPTTEPSATSSYCYCYGHSADPADKCMYWYSYKTTADHFSLLRQFHLDKDSTYEISAWVRSGTSSSYATKFSAMIGTATNNLDTLVSLTKVGQTISSQYIGSQYWYYYNTLYDQLKTVFTPDSTGDYYIGYNIAAGNTYSYIYSYFDDWTIRSYAGCAPKVPTIDSVTTSSVHVTMSGSAYQFEYVLNDTTAATTIVDTTEFNITGLTPATSYTLYVRVRCDSANHSDWLSVSFTTDCGTITSFPYIQDFESYPADQTPNCWSNTASTASCYSGPVWGVHSYNSNKMLRVDNYNTQDGDAIIETPSFSLPAQPVELSFDYTNHSANDLYVKISTNGGATYSTIGTYPATGTGSYSDSNTDPGTFTHAIIDLTAYANQGNVKFELSTETDYSYGAAFFDNMMVSFVPACREPQTAPTVTATTMTTLSAQASMANKDTIEFGIAPYSASVTTASITDTVISTDGYCTFTGLTGNTHYAVWYRYRCGADGVSGWSLSYANGTTMSTDCFDPQNLRTVGVVNDHHAAITWGVAPNAYRYDYELYQGTSASGTLVDSSHTAVLDTVVYDSLAANTAYYFRVRGYCSGDTTAWAGISVHTTYPTLTLPFICNFENTTQNNSWNFNNINSGTNELMIGTGVNNGGSKALYVSDDGSTHNYTSTASSTCDAEVLLEMTAGNYQVSYDWEAQGESCCDYGRVFLVPSSTTITSISASTLPSGAISLDNGSRLNSQGTWASISKIITISTDGVYKLVVGWYNDGSVGTQPPLAVDNIRIEELQCMPLTSVTNISLGSHSAKYLATRYTAGLDLQYGYSTIDNQDSITWNTIQGTSLTDTIPMTGLSANTTYYLFVRELCDSAHISSVTRIVVTTPNDAQSLPFICGFETTETTTAAWQFAGDSNEFVVGTGASSQGSRAMYISDDGSSWNYSTTTISNSYAYVPLAFGAGTYDIEFEWNGQGESSYDYGRVYLAPASFIPTAGTMASGIGTTTTPTGWIAIDGGSELNLASSWQSVSAEQTFADSTTMNLLVYWHNDGSLGTQPPFAIDNIRITKQLCSSLSFDSLSVDTISTNMFTLHYYNPTATAQTQYIISSNSAMSDTVATGIAAAGANSFTVTGLSAGTVYYGAIYSVCGPDTLSKALRFNIRTQCAVMTAFPYDEGFETMTANTYNLLTQACWATTTMSSTLYGVASTTSTCVHTGNQGLYVYNGGSTTATQTYALPEMDSLNGKTVSFWYKAYQTSSTYTTYNYLDFGYINASGSFVSLSQFNNVTAWQQYSQTLANLPAGVTRLAFKFTGADYYYLDDIHINNIVNGNTYTDTICSGAAYTGHGFSFSAGQLHDGDTTFTSTIQATTVGAADSVTTLNIHVRPAITTDIYDTICAGQPYNRGLFNITNPTTRTYFRTFTSAITGCDSTVNLYLYVYPTNETINDTICQGDSYSFGGQTITTTGMYTATITNKWGCTVTQTLNLLVVDTTSTTNATICNGESYQFEGQTYTQSGTYHVTVTGAGGCPVHKTLVLSVMKSDSTMTVSYCKGGSVIVIDTVISSPGYYTIRRFTQTDPQNPQVGCYTNYHVTVTENAILEGRVSDYACEGIPYSGYGVRGIVITKDTVIDVTTKNAQMCDSVTHVSLTFTPTTYGSEDAYIKQGESYTWHNNTYNVAGTYTDTISSSLGCDSVCTLNLHVSGTGVDNVTDVTINIVPNPVNPGATAYIYGNFGEATKVEILNNFGQVIDQFVPQSYPIEVSGISASGLYYVRITASDGTVHVQKLMVK